MLCPWNNDWKIGYLVCALNLINCVINVCCAYFLHFWWPDHGVPVAVRYIQVEEGRGEKKHVMNKTWKIRAMMTTVERRGQVFAHKTMWILKNYCPSDVLKGFITCSESESLVDHNSMASGIYVSEWSESIIFHKSIRHLFRWHRQNTKISYRLW